MIEEIKMNRVLLKLSGEALAGDKKTGFDEDTCVAVAKQVKTIVDKGVQKFSEQKEWILMCIHLLHAEHGLSYFQRMRQ